MELQPQHFDDNVKQAVICLSSDWLGPRGLFGLRKYRDLVQPGELDDADGVVWIPIRALPQSL